MSLAADVALVVLAAVFLAFGATFAADLWRERSQRMDADLARIKAQIRADRAAAEQPYNQELDRLEDYANGDTS